MFIYIHIELIEATCHQNDLSYGNLFVLEYKRMCVLKLCEYWSA